MSDSTIVHVAQAGGLLLISMGAGAGVAASAMLIPAILTVPHAARLRAWRTSYDIGAASMPKLAMCAAATHGYLAYIFRQNQQPVHATLYAASILALLANIPFTHIFIMPTNDRLTEGLHAEEASKQSTSKDSKLSETESGETESVKTSPKPRALSEAEGTRLLVKWQARNAQRTLLMIGACLMSAYASLIL